MSGDWKDKAVETADAYELGDLAVSSPRAALKAVKGIERARAKAKAEAMEARKKCRPTLADVWPV